MESDKLRSKHYVVIIRSLVMALLIFTKSALAYDAVDVLPKVRIGTADNKFKNTYQVAAVFERSAPRIFRAQRLEIAIGSVSTTRESESFVSVGPVWKLPSWNERTFLEFGFSPTFLSGSTFNGRDAGGRLHFTSSISVGIKLGRNKTSSISLRIQHMSNGGLHNTNPGLDMFGLEFSFRNFE